VAYGPAVDMWSVGCVLSELLLGRPLFPADGELELLRLHVQLLGSPNTRIWPSMETLPGASLLAGMPLQPYNLIARTFPMVGQAGVQLLNGLLTYDPAQRLTADEALRHAFFSERPYPKAPIDMPTFPPTHAEGPASKRARHGSV